MSRDPLQDASIEELISRARAGDQAALDELFRRYRPILRKWAKRRLSEVRRDSGFASDVAQETARRAFERFMTLRGSGEIELNRWLSRILDRCIRGKSRFAKRKKRDDRVTVPLDSSVLKHAQAQGMSPSQNVAQEEKRRWLVLHLSRLPKAQREAIWLCQLKELSAAEAAKKMGKPEGAIGGLLARGLKTLRSRLNRGSGGDPDVDLAEPGPKRELEVAIMSYLRRRDAMEEIDREAFLAEHASCADELRPMLDFIDSIQAIWDAHPESDE